MAVSILRISAHQAILRAPFDLFLSETRVKEVLGYDVRRVNQRGSVVDLGFVHLGEMFQNWVRPLPLEDILAAPPYHRDHYLRERVRDENYPRTHLFICRVAPIDDQLKELTLTCDMHIDDWEDHKDRSDWAAGYVAQELKRVRRELDEALEWKRRVINRLRAPV